jgi:hypothetical protein
MDHQFKIGDIVRFKNGKSPDLTVVSIGPQSVSVACYDADARAHGIAQNFNGTYFHADLELIAGTNTKAKANRNKKSAKGAKSTDAATANPDASSKE